MTQKKNHQKTNGHAGAHGHANGGVPASAERGGIPVQGDRAASDDANGASVAMAVISAAAGTDHEAYADAAPPQPPRKNRKTGQAKGTGGGGSLGGETMNIPPGAEPLPADGAGFVAAMHEHVDIYKACARLVKSKDEKIAQRMVERLLEMAYGKGPSVQTEESAAIIFDLPRPERELP